MYRRTLFRQLPRSMQHMRRFIQQAVLCLIAGGVASTSAAWLAGFTLPPSRYPTSAILTRVSDGKNAIVVRAENVLRVRRLSFDQDLFGELPAPTAPAGALSECLRLALQADLNRQSVEAKRQPGRYESDTPLPLRRLQAIVSLAPWTSVSVASGYAETMSDGVPRVGPSHDGTTWWALEVIDSTGWPFSAFECSLRIAPLTCSEPFYAEEHRAFLEPYGEFIAWHGLQNSAVDLAAHRPVPLAPVWRGLLANGLVWSLSIATVLAASRAVVTSFRRRQGRCPRCGFDRTQSTEPRCPECGTLSRTDEQVCLVRAGDDSGPHLVAHVALRVVVESKGNRPVHLLARDSMRVHPHSGDAPFARSEP